MSLRTIPNDLIFTTQTLANYELLVKTLKEKSDMEETFFPPSLMGTTGYEERSVNDQLRYMKNLKTLIHQEASARRAVSYCRPNSLGIP